MRILLTGANGFLGRYLLAALLEAGHDVVPAVRNTATTDRLLPRGSRALRVDFNRDIRVEDWTPRLAGIDAVINCAGILQDKPGQSIEAIHFRAPTALFKACEAANVRRVIQMSAISANVDAGTAYAATKLEADTTLRSTDLDWIVVRPSLVYASGAYGGTALMRALASLPFFVPSVGDGLQLFQPVHVDDLSAFIVKALATPSLRQVTVEPCGPDRLTLKAILLDLRRWLGFAPAPTLNIPLWLVAALSRMGDVLGGPLNTTALRQLLHGNAGATEPFERMLGRKPLRWSEQLLVHPAQAQDRWHARIYFLRPALRGAVALTWIGSGVSGLLRDAPIEHGFSLLGIAIPPAAFALACLIDILIGIAVLIRWRTTAVAAIQLATVFFYTVVLTVTEPGLWLEPFGPLLKNVPFIVAIAMLAAIEPDR